MDPFLPGEVPVMVLRYLAANQCVASAMKLIEEMPRLKDFIPAKPAHVSESLYLKHLLRSSVNPGLKDILWDYRSSKILVEEILDGDEETFQSCTSESLLTKMKTMQEKLKEPRQTTSAAQHSSRKEDEEKLSIVPAVVTVDSSTSTDAYDCPKCLARRLETKPKADSGCQTEEITAVQFGLQQNDIPVIFCETLLKDDNLQQKIAQTINEHMEDPQGEKKIPETEMDKFLVELLQDMPLADDSNSMQSETGLLQTVANSVADIERNLSSMFADTDCPIVSNANASNSSSLLNPPLVPDKQPSSVQEIYTQETSSRGSNTSISDTSVTPSSSKLCDISKETPAASQIISDFITPPGTAGTPKQSQRLQSVKRITPTPLSTVNVNPVFNTSVIIENKTVGTGDKSGKVAVISKKIEKPIWRQLNRRGIEPKIPGRASKITNNMTLSRQCTETEEAFDFEDYSNRNLKYSHPPGSRLKANEFSGGTGENKNLPSSAHKRKATPVKLTPEKAKNMEYNFMHFYCDNNKNPTTSTKSSNSDDDAKNRGEADSTVKKTPVQSSSPASSSMNQSDKPLDINNRPILLSENSQHDVTPMQPPPVMDTFSNSTLKTISPNALQRLVASATKLTTTNVARDNFMNKKKSYSTPRKRKHVRNLSFTTPPSLKSITPGSAPFIGETSLKRKANEDLSSADLRSKKRLNWPESEKKNTAVGIIARRPSDSVVTSSTAEASSENEDNIKVKCGNQQQSKIVSSLNINGSDITSGNVSKLSMPTILEESMSNASMSIDTVEQHPTNGSNQQQQKQLDSAPLKPISGSQKQISIVSIPSIINGIPHTQWYQLTDDNVLFPIDPIGFLSETDVSVNATAPCPPSAPSSHQQEQAANHVSLSNKSQFNMQVQPTSDDVGKVSKQEKSKAKQNNKGKKPAQSVASQAVPLGSPRKSPRHQQWKIVDPEKVPVNKSLPKVLSLSNEATKDKDLSIPIGFSSEPDVPVNATAPCPPSSHQQEQAANHVSLSNKSQFNMQVQPTSDEVGKGSKKERSKTKRNNKGKKPAIVLNMNNLFGNSPMKKLNEKAKLPEDVVAAQSVASQAVPLGSPRRSPRHQQWKKVDPEKVPVNKSLPKVLSLSNEGAEDKDLPIPIGFLSEPNVPVNATAPCPPLAPSSHQQEQATNHVSLSNKSQFNMQVQPTSDEVGKDSKKERSKTKRNNKGKKPAITLNMNNLFGNSPMKKLNEKAKLPKDVVAAQSVASQAVPLGSPRKSPRRQQWKTVNPEKVPVNKSLQKVLSLSNESIEDKDLPKAPEIEMNTELQTQSAAITEQQLTDNIVFNIVPAPIGFPEPTPIKNFSDTGCLNISDISCNINGPLITPFKSVPPPCLNDTHFTLPPTPRVMLEDNDSNSNSAHSLKLVFDGLYPANLFHSTPLKPGIPRTPGRGSSSSNSQSPTQPGKIIGIAQNLIQNQNNAQRHQQPPISAPISSQIHLANTNSSLNTTTVTTTVNKVIATATALDLSSPLAKNKSDGEISSSEDEDIGNSQNLKGFNRIPQKPPLPPKNLPSRHQYLPPPVILQNQPQGISSSSTISSHHPRSNPRPPPLQSRSHHISVSLNPNLKQTHGINFHVGGREKLLTMSEKETLVSLMSMRNGANGGEISEPRKEIPTRPVVIKPSPPVKTPAPAPQKPINDEVSARNFIQSTSLDRLLKVARRRTQMSNRN